MTEKKRLKVFLSHAHSDAPAVRELFRYLRREGVDIWLDKEKLLPGMDWNSEIRKAVRESDVVVVCLSNEFNKAGYRQREVRIALDTEQEKPEGEIYIIPARLEVCDVPKNLSKWQWVDLFEKGGRQRLIRALRVRADQIGTSLRRRRGDKSSAVSSENGKADDLTKQPTSTHEDEDIDSIPLPMDLPPKLNTYFAESKLITEPITRFGIWIDKKKNVWRDSKKLGTLAESSEYRLLTHLIKHRGYKSSYEILAAVAYLEL